MHVASFLGFVCLGFILAEVWGSSRSSGEASCTEHSWCYQGCAITPSQWKRVCGSKCNGARQSPININTDTVIFDPSLKNFTFSNFSYAQSIRYLINTGHTVQCVLENDVVTVKGGGLRYEYVATQLHFHWGNTTNPGSEHSINQHRHLMEMHIVALRKGLTVQNAAKDPEGIAVLGFFIDGTSEKETPDAWKHLASYLVNISDINTNITMNPTVSITDLLNGVDLSKFYRYNGSLTTPTCDEAVVWTVFEGSINVSEDLIYKFPESMNYQNIYRPQQDLNGRKVLSSFATNSNSGHSWCYNGCELSVSHWDALHHSYCGGKEQSPINIHTSNVIPDANLKDFHFVNFDNLHAITALQNTGHTVACLLVENNVEIGGGGLKEQYFTVQVHFHWGNMSGSSLGSEHSVDAKRYPMEMHIVNVKKGLTMNEAKMHPGGLAVLGFFIESVDEQVQHNSHVTTPSHQVTTMEENQNRWKTLTSYLEKIKTKGSTVELNESISLDNLIGNVDRSQYYRYTGSLTTPTCDEGVIWTVFKQPIQVDKNLVMMFPTQMGYVNIFRPQQPLNQRGVYTSLAPAHRRPLAFSLLVALLLVLFGVDVLQ